MEYYVTRMTEDDELMHYGVLGMKWGHRKAVPTSSTYNKMKSTRSQYKQAKKDYNKSFNKAYNYSYAHPIGQYVSKKKKDESNRRWSDAYDKANALDKAKTNYKQAKNERKDKIKSTYRDIQKNASLGEKLTYSNGTRMKAAKYVVDNNMSIQDAKAKANKDAVRYTAAVMAVYGAIAVANFYAMNR